MTNAQTNPPAPGRPVRLWPGVVALIGQWLLWFVTPLVAPDAVLVAGIGGLFAGLVVVVWWLFLSRAPWPDRLGALVLMIVAVIATRPVLHRSIRGAGQGMMFYF